MKPRRQTIKAPQLEPKFLRLVKKLSAENRDVTHNTGKGFGSGALKVKGKIFAMLSSKGQLVVKLSKQRVDELVASGQGDYFDPGHGRLMKQWLAVTAQNAPGLKLANEAYQFVKSEASK